MNAQTVQGTTIKGFDCTICLATRNKGFRKCFYILCHTPRTQGIHFQFPKCNCFVSHQNAKEALKENSVTIRATCSPVNFVQIQPNLLKFTKTANRHLARFLKS